jgi:hypothetical protein
VGLKRQLFFFIIQRNLRRWTKDDLASTGFLRFAGGCFNIFILLCSLLDCTTGG